MEFNVQRSFRKVLKPRRRAGQNLVDTIVGQRVG